MKNLNYLLSLILLMPIVSVAQDSSDTDVEEVVVVGSQIKGASITDVLPVTVLSADDIEALGVGDGDELIEQVCSALVTVMTRCFGHTEMPGQMALCPLIDLMNHNPSQNTSFAL